MKPRIFVLTLCLTLAWAVPTGGGEGAQMTWVACYGVWERSSGNLYYSTVTMKPLAASFPLTAKEARTLWELHLTEYHDHYAKKNGCTVQKSPVAARLRLAEMLNDSPKRGKFTTGGVCEHDWLNDLTP